MKKTLKSLNILILILCMFTIEINNAYALAIEKPLIPVTKDFILTNGLRVILSEDHNVPVAAIAIVYDVGARDERKGRSGFAHFFEHMMFQGSDNVGKAEHFKFIESVGGTLNASTHADFTNYFEKVPSNQLELCLWLESDRMRSLKVTETNFQNQLETVKEEKRSRIDNQPYIPSALKLNEILFDNWSNAHPTIGSFEDLDAATIDDIKSFFKTYYAPNNAVMAIVGDFDSNQMQKLVEKYFASIPRADTPPKPDVSEIKQNKIKYTKINDKHAQLPAFWLGWKAPAKRENDYFPLVVLDKILSSGDSSRLYQRLIKGEKVAIEASTEYDTRRGPGAFQTFVIFKKEHNAEKVRNIVFDEIDKLKNNLVSEKELEKARNQILRTYFAGGSYTSLQRCLGKAEMLAEYTSFFGNPNFIDEDLSKLLAVSPKDIQRVAKQYLSKNEITIIDVEPEEKQEKASK